MKILAPLFILACAAFAAEEKGTAIGVALTPRNFPKFSATDVADMFDTAQQIGPYAVSMFQWSQGDAVDVATKFKAMCDTKKLSLILGLSPTELGGMRSKLDAPAAIRAKIAGKLSFTDESVRQSYIDTAVAMAKLKPAYLCLATEINMLAMGDLPEYMAFAAVCKKIFPVLKKLSPETKLFVSFQWDFIAMMDEKEPAKVKEHSKLIDIFRPEIDAIAFTSYPAERFGSVALIPANFYERILEHTQAKDEILFMELGWPSAGMGTEKSQLEFVQRFPTLMQKVKPSIVAWSLLHDVAGVFGQNLATTGLITNSGKSKPAFDAFKKLQPK